MNPTRYILIALLFCMSGCASFKGDSFGEDVSLGAMAEALALQYSDAGAFDDPDKQYFPSIWQILKAESAAKWFMKRDGWVYIPNSQDCDNFAQKLSIEMQHYITVNYPESHGKSVMIGVEIIKIKEATFHMRVKAYYGKRKFISIENS